ncbi:murein hydrolase activator EnvC family protein [Micromonospora krabiensis]|uniref:Peptidase family M23 n=1 Tax=Micromonospora krabiensis TaxID=307121 RepID=A0A1C3N453_9ACTN|nr:M23 family metallopeptidase [Micromonospora krabiensis]SBV27351.1 Peptidase family M23 [Micromonospora krabiensis]
MRSPPSSAPAEIRRTLLLCTAVPLWLTVQFCAVVLVAALPAAAGARPTDGGPPGRLTTAPVSAPPVVAGGFRWPVDGPPRPVRRFDPPPRPWLPGHRGVDLAAPPGATVRAAGPGTVLFAGPVAGRPVVTVGHSDGLRTTYEPARPSVAVGASVAAGDAVGVLLDGHPGCPVAACLHWGLRRGEEYLDPMALLGLGPVRLLPLDGRQP